MLPSVLTVRVLVHMKSSSCVLWHNSVCPARLVTAPPTPSMAEASWRRMVARHTHVMLRIHPLGPCVLISAPVCFWGSRLPPPQSRCLGKKARSVPGECQVQSQVWSSLLQVLHEEKRGVVSALVKFFWFCSNILQVRAVGWSHLNSCYCTSPPTIENLLPQILFPQKISPTNTFPQKISDTVLPQILNQTIFWISHRGCLVCDRAQQFNRIFSEELLKCVSGKYELLWVWGALKTMEAISVLVLTCTQG